MKLFADLYGNRVQIDRSKGDFTIDHWVKEKQFNVSLLLKAKERILASLYPEKAELAFPTLQIDDKVSEYLRGTLLTYYLWPIGRSSSRR